MRYIRLYIKYFHFLPQHSVVVKKYVTVSIIYCFNQDHIIVFNPKVQAIVCCSHAILTLFNQENKHSVRIHESMKVKKRTIADKHIIAGTLTIKSSRISVSRKCLLPLKLCILHSVSIVVMVQPNKSQEIMKSVFAASCYK